MPLHPDFPTDPHAVLDPAIRWYPGEAMLAELGYEMLLPPLVHKVRQGVKAWRDAGYSGASETTRVLLNYWFRSEHLLPGLEGQMVPFQYYFAQREAVESAIWLHEVEQARDSYSLLKYDSSGAVSKRMFDEDWPRYVLKLATGAGKTKVMSLLIAWSFFHRRYEAESDLSTNFLLIAPNIIVLDRLRVDFDGFRIFHEDPVLPPNGYAGQNWDDDFQLTLHIQDEVQAVSTTGNLFLTNIQRVFESGSEPSFEDDDATDYFLGKRPTGKTTDSKADLGRIVRDVPDLLILNDEAHHIHDPSLAWFKSIQDISNQLRLKDSKLSAQFDLTATPKHNDGGIFVQTVADYPLVEAIRQGVVKVPVLPDEASRAKLEEHTSTVFTERYRDFLHLGYTEWKQYYDDLLPAGKKSVLFVMTDDTRNCDEVKEYLQKTYPEFAGDEAVLVIHTKNNGDISESSTGKGQAELKHLRDESRAIDGFDNPVKAIVSVMMLKEGWDVQNVVTIVGLRPYSAKSKILPEQTLGRGLRPMFRGQGVKEQVSVVGTQAFVEFVESLKTEGVELEYSPMGPGARPKPPLVIEPDRDNKQKDLEALDIELPMLLPRLHRQYKNLADLNVDALPHKPLLLKTFTPEQQRQIVFKELDTDTISHVTVLDTTVEPNYQSVVGFFAKALQRDLHLVGGFDVLFGKLKDFIERRLFTKPVHLADGNVLRNLSEPDVSRALVTAFKGAINALVVQDKGTTHVQQWIKFGQLRPFVVTNQAYLVPKRSVFNKIVTDLGFELTVAGFLDGCEDIVSFVKNSQSTQFRIEYRTADGGISNYYPDFVVKRSPAEIWVIETKGREDVEDPGKWQRLVQWCADATSQVAGTTYSSLFVPEDDWEKFTPKNFAQLVDTFKSSKPKGKPA